MYTPDVSSPAVFPFHLLSVCSSAGRAMCHYSQSTAAVVAVAAASPDVKNPLAAGDQPGTSWPATPTTPRRDSPPCRNKNSNKNNNNDNDNTPCGSWADNANRSGSALAASCRDLCTTWPVAVASHEARQVYSCPGRLVAVYFRRHPRRRTACRDRCSPGMRRWLMTARSSVSTRMTGAEPFTPTRAVFSAYVCRRTSSCYSRVQQIPL